MPSFTRCFAARLRRASSQIDTIEHANLECRQGYRVDIRNGWGVCGVKSKFRLGVRGKIID